MEDEMKKRITIFLAIGLMTLGMVSQDREHVLRLGDFMKPKAATYDLSPYLRADGTIPLTADWNVGAFDLTCVDMTATNFKLSGVGTLTSALGNVSLTTSLTAASGNEVGFELPVTVNKAAGNYTAFKINATEISAPGTTDYLMDLRVGGASRAFVKHNGYFGSIEGFGNSNNTAYMGFEGNAFKFMVYSYCSFYLTGDLAAGNAFRFSSSTDIEFTDTGGSQAWLYVEPKINQSGTAGYQALKINVTETALGDGTTGANRLFTAQISDVEKAGVDNKGAFNSTMINNADSDTDEVDSVTWAGGYGMVIAASTTDGTSAIWKLKGTTFEAIEVDADWTAVKDNAGTYNVYFDSGAIKLQNKVGNDKAVKLGYFGI
jgi:hypothetical protein